MGHRIISKFGGLIALIAAGIVAASAVGSALATVTFDPGTGAGYIGRGDVLSNPDLGKGALTASPSVALTERLQISQTCEKETRRTLVSVEMKRIRNLTLQVQSQTKAAPGNGNVAGYVLKGFAGAASVPSIACPDGFSPVDSPTLVALGSSLTFSGNGLVGTVWSE